VVIITLLYYETMFPAEQSNKIGKVYIEWLKDNPPDTSISTNVCIGIISTDDGVMKSIGISRIAPGKEKEALEDAARLGLFSAEKIDGYKFVARIMWDFPEAYKIIGMAAPKV